jgi:hypothetical protein
MRIYKLLLVILVAHFSVFANAGELQSSDQTIINDQSTLIAYFDCKTGKKVEAISDSPISSDLSNITIAASGFCELHQDTNGKNYCTKGTCAGTCKLNNIPVSCSCD